jgi:hypothetical protein
MKRYAWKIKNGNGAAVEGISSLEELETVIAQAALPARQTPSEIVTLTKTMQFEGQGVYRHRAPGEEWTLLWIELR